MINEKVRKTLDELDNNGVVYLEYLGYSTSEEDEEQSEQVLFEPFVPNDRDNFYSLVSMLRDTGHISQYNAIWISAHDYPIQTIVEHKNKRYRVVNIQDLTDYSNVTLYYLQSEDSNDGN